MKTTTLPSSTTVHHTTGSQLQSLAGSGAKEGFRNKVLTKLGLFAFSLFLFQFFSVIETSGQCTPNTILFNGSQPIYNSACGNNSYQTINGSTPTGSGQTYQWRFSLNGGSLTTISSTGIDLPKSDITNLILTPSGNTSGNYAIQRIVYDATPSSCSSTSANIFLYYSQNASQISGGTITPGTTTSCTTATGTLTLQGYTGPILRWELTTNGGSTWTIVTNTTNLYNYSLVTPGTYCYRALVDNICDGTLGSIDALDIYSSTACVSVNALPATPTGTTPQSFCIGATVADLTATGTAIQWYADPTGGTALLFTTPLVDATIYHASQTVGGCESAARFAVTVSVANPTTPIVGTITQPTCAVPTGSVALSGLPPTGTWTINPGALTGSGTSTIISNLGAGTYNYTVTNSLGCTSSGTTTVTIIASPTPTASASAGTIPCNGGTTTLTVTAGGGIPPYTYSIDGGTTTQTTNTFTVGAGTYTATVQDANGCTKEATAVAVVINPDASVASVSGLTPLCIGATDTYVANTVVLGGGTGAWSSSDPLVATVNSTTGLVTGVSAGISTITYTITGGCNGTPSADKVVTITPDAAITSVTGTTPLCIGATATYTTIGVVLGGGSGAWSSSNTGIATVNSTTGLVTGVSAGTCTITYTITGGCNGTPSADKVVTITPNASVASVSGTTPLCIGATDTYVANTVVLGGGTGAWSSSNTGIATVNSSTGLVTGVSAGTCSITYTITGGCGGTKSAQQAVTITPNAAITSVTGTTPLCIGATATYTSTGVVLGGGSGAWSSSNTGIATVNSTTGLVTGAGAGTCDIIYTVTGCNGPVSKQQAVTITPNAAITSVTGTTPLCIGATATYTTTGLVLGGGSGAWSSSNPLVATVNSSTGLVTGAGAGTTTITYTITGGCNGTPSAAQAVTITPNQPVSVSIAASSNPVCTGTPVTFTATPTNGGTTPSYQWKVNGSDVGTNSATYTSALANGSTITVLMTSNAPCAIGSQATSNIVTMTVNPTLPVSVSIAKSANLVCAGTLVTFTATPTNGGASPSYQWKVNGNNAGINNAIFTYAPANGDGISVVMTSNAICASGNPATSNTETMTVYPLPVPTITGLTTVCNGTTGVTYTTEAAKTGYAWTVSGGTITAGTGTSTITVTWNTAGVQTVTVNYFTANGCTAVAATFTNVTVNPLPVPSINGPASVCVGSTGVIYTTEASMTGYSWVVSGGTITAGTGTKSITVTWNSTGTQSVSLNYTNGNGCTAANASVLYVGVWPILPVSILITPSANPACSNSLVTFTATPFNSGMTPAYQWKVNGNNAGTNNYTFTYAPDNNDLVTCVLTSTEACTSGNPATSNTVTMTVNPLLPAGVSIAASANPACAGGSVTFTATPTNGGTTPVYQWYKGATPVGTNAAVYSYVPLNGDVISVVMTSNATPCMVGSPATSTPVTMTVNPLLPVSVSISPSDNQKCAGTLITYTATPVNGGSFPSYQWKVNGTNVGANQMTYSYVPANTDVVTCVLTSSEICTSGNPATSNAVVMTVYPMLPVSVTIAPTANPVCANTPVTFVATAINGGNNPRYQWRVNGVNTDTNFTNRIYTYTPANNDVIYCVLSSNELCTYGNPATSNTVTMTVNPLLPVSISISASANPVCAGSPVTIKASATNGGSLPVYQWIVNGSYAGPNSSSFTYNPINGDAISCLLTSNVNCAIGNPATSNTVTMTVNPLPVPVITGAATVFAGTTGVVYTTQAGQMKYFWTISPGGAITSGGTATDNTATVTWSTAGAQWIRVNFADVQTGCSAAVATQFNVTVAEAPYIAVTSPNGGEDWLQGSEHSITWTHNITGNVKIELFKAGAFLQLIVGSTSSTGPFLWSIPEDQLLAADFKVKISSITTPSLFDMSDNNFTISTNTHTNREVQNVIVAGGQSICFDAKQTIFVAGGGTTFLVQTGGIANFIAGQNIIYGVGTKIEPGGYMRGRITTTGEYCGSSAPSIPAVITGEGEVTFISGQPLFKIYPNPTDGKFTLEYIGEGEIGKTNVELYSMNGEKILSKDLMGERQHEFSLAARPIGIYLIRIVSEGNTNTMRIIKQ